MLTTSRNYVNGSVATQQCFSCQNINNIVQMAKCSQCRNMMKSVPGVVYTSIRTHIRKDCTSLQKDPLCKFMNHGPLPWILNFNEKNFLASIDRLSWNKIRIMCYKDLFSGQVVLSVWERVWYEIMSSWSTKFIPKAVGDVGRSSCEPSSNTELSHLMHPLCVTSCLNFSGCFYLVMHLNHQGSSKQLWWR